MRIFSAPSSRHHVAHGAFPDNPVLPLGVTDERRPAVRSVWIAGGDVLVLVYTIVYTEDMRFTWNEIKRQSNLKKHGLDFADAAEVLGQPVVYQLDDRQDYGEERWRVYGRLRGLTIAMVVVEEGEDIRVISMRLATPREIQLFEQEVQRDPGRANGIDTLLQQLDPEPKPTPGSVPKTARTTDARTSDVEPPLTKGPN
jgi:uncharacterized protein